eukprot:scaffold20159_cov55-Phaeocystis_antarctica.AAC.5
MPQLSSSCMRRSALVTPALGGVKSDHKNAQNSNLGEGGVNIPGASLFLCRPPRSFGLPRPFAICVCAHAECQRGAEATERSRHTAHRRNDQHGMGVVLVERLGRCFRRGGRLGEGGSAIPAAVVLCACGTSREPPVFTSAAPGFESDIRPYTCKISEKLQAHVRSESRCKAATET